MVYVTVNQHKLQYSVWNINNDTCLSFAIICNGEVIRGKSFSQINPNFLSQDQMDVYVYGNATVNNMHNIMLFRGLICLVVPLWSGAAFHVMRGQIFIFLILTS